MTFLSPSVFPIRNRAPCTEKSEMKHLILPDDPPHGTEGTINSLRIAHARARNNPES